MTTLGTATYTIRLTHPATNRFIAEFDPVRMLLYVVDRGHAATIDLVRVMGTVIFEPQE